MTNLPHNFVSVIAYVDSTTDKKVRVAFPVSSIARIQERGKESSLIVFTDRHQVIVMLTVDAILGMINAAHG